MTVWRTLLALGLLVLALAPAAGAQAPTPTPAADEQEPAPTPEAETDEQEPEPTPPPGCERGPGTDADYAYCPDVECPEPNDDADYVYGGCPVAAPGGTGDPSPTPEPRVAARPLAAQTLPVTGSESLLIAAAGLGFLLAGAGLRLRFR